MLKKIKYLLWDFIEWISHVIISVIALIIGIPISLIIALIILAFYLVFILAVAIYNLIGCIINGVFDLLKGGK